jgi:hypothetical protein
MAKAATSKKAKPKRGKKQQYERFLVTARKLEVDETGEAFERAFRKIAPPKLAKEKTG